MCVLCVCCLLLFASAAEKQKQASSTRLDARGSGTMGVVCACPHWPVPHQRVYSPSFPFVVGRCYYKRRGVDETEPCLSSDVRSLLLSFPFCYSVQLFLSRSFVPLLFAFGHQMGMMKAVARAGCLAVITEDEVDDDEKGVD